MSISMAAREVGGKLEDLGCRREGGMVERVQIRRWSGGFAGYLVSSLASSVSRTGRVSWLERKRKGKAGRTEGVKGGGGERKELLT
jgi:hypothetical protein